MRSCSFNSNCLFRISAAGIVFGALVAANTSAAVAQENSSERQADGETAQREAEFKAMLSGVTLVGNFTVTGRERTNLREERYTLNSVEKLPNGRWMFTTRIRYGDHDVTVPLPLPVAWAGDTPMIVVDKLEIPGLGTFDARVMFFRNHYAGYWAHGDVGGHLFGVIERDAEDEE